MYRFRRRKYPKFTSGNWLIRSGRLKIGQIKRLSPVAYGWQSFRGSKDGGVTNSFSNAKRRILNSAGISERQYEISSEPTTQHFKWNN